MKHTFALLAALSAFVATAIAAPESFDFKDPNAVNNVAFKLVAPMETIAGTANGVSGTVSYDPEHPDATSGKIVVTSASLTVPNAMQSSIMHNGTWLDSAKYPEITFEAKSLANLKTDGNTNSADVTGTFTLKGISKEVTFPVKMTYLKDKLADTQPGKKGDLLVIRGTFDIKRKDFNVNPGQSENKVSDTITLTFGIAGSSPK